MVSWEGACVKVLSKKATVWGLIREMKLNIAVTFFGFGLTQRATSDNTLDRSFSIDKTSEQNVPRSTYDDLIINLLDDCGRYDYDYK